MGWSHEDSWEVRLVLGVLESLRRDSECVSFETGEVRHGLNFAREWTIPKFYAASDRRFDFAVWTTKGSRMNPEFFIEVHGKQHYELTFMGEKISASDRLKGQWAAANKISLLVLRDNDVLRLHSNGELAKRIKKFLGLSSPIRRMARRSRAKK